MINNKENPILLMVFTLIFCLIAAGAVSAADPPTANFTSNVTNGTGPLNVQFNDTSTGNATGWNWDFGDNATSTEQNPTHIYINEGSYSVSLTALNADGNSTITQNDYIKVAIPPTVTNSLTGATYNTTQTVTLTTDDPTATIYYANDTTDPRTSSTRITYTGPITINTTTTLRYAAVDTQGNWSPLYLQNYVIGTNSSWPKFQGNLNNTGQSSYDGPQTATTLWTYATGGYIYYASPVIGADGTIYIGSYDSNLYALNPDGTLKWTYTTGGRIYSSATIGSDGTIYVGSYDSKLYVINPDGTLKWIYTTEARIYGSAAIGTDGTIYIGSYDKNIYAINPDGTLKWNYTTGNYIYSYGGGPAIGTDGIIYIGSYDGKLYALNPDGTLKWNYTTGARIYGSAAIGTDGTIYIGSYDKNIYAINPDGTLKWNYTTGNYIYGSPAIGTDGTIYIGSYDNNLYALNPNGTLKWNYTTGSRIYGSPAIGTDGTIYIGSYDSKLYALNPNGTLKWNYTTGNYIYGSPAIGTDGTLYIGSRDYKLYALKDVVTEANFTSNLNPLIVQFTDTSTHDPNSWYWDFGDGTNSTERNPTHTYTMAGIYTVALTVTNNIGTDTETKTNYIKIPVAANVTNGLYNHTLSIGLTSINNTGTIYYTIDGTDPTNSSTSTEYTGAISINSTTTLQYALLEDSANWSSICAQTYTIDMIAPTVTANMVSGSYDTTLSVLLTSDDAEAIIYYTIDGTDPTTNSTQYTNPISITNTTTLKYAAVDTAINWSPIYTQIYTLTTVVATIPSGLYNNTLSVSLICNNDTLTIYYTTDGSDPTTSSTQYTNPISITNTTTLKYAAVDSSSNWSPIYTQIYTIDTQAPTVNASLTGGTYNGTQTVTLTSDDPTATIYYANDTTDPRTSDTKIQYTTPINISETTTLRYAALDPAGNWSPVYIQNYVIGNNVFENITGQSTNFGPQNNSTLSNFTIDSTISSAPTIGSDGTIYIGSNDGKLYAFNPDGTLKWTYTTGAAITVSPAIGSNGTIYVGSNDGNLYALNPTGDLKWFVTVGTVTKSITLASDGRVYVVGSSTLYCIIDNGTDAIIKWSVGSGTAAVVGSDGTIYFGSPRYTPYIYAYNPDGTMKWYFRQMMGQNIDDSAVIGPDGTIYVLYGSYLNAIIDNGTEMISKWNINPGSLTTGAFLAVGSDGTVYWGWQRGKTLTAIIDNGTTYTTKWTYTTDSAITTYPVIGADGTIYFCAGTTAYALNSNGTLKWSYSFNSTVYNAHTIGSDEILYVVSSDGTLYAIGDPTIFSANTTSGESPLTVQFNSTSRITPTSFLWDFGDGTTSTLQNPTHTYNTPGNYNVSLTVTDSNGTSTTATKTNYIKIYKTPIANFTTSTDNGMVPVTVQFTDTSTNNPTTWTWDFGDGTTSTEQNPTHTYNSAGNFSVSLTVSNPLGSDTSVAFITVTMPSIPVTNFTTNATLGYVPFTVQFNDTSTGYGISSWLWDFGDGTTSTEQNPTHTYTTPGNYTVSLTTTNSAGNNTLTQADLITVPMLVVDFSADKTMFVTWGVYNATVQFNDTSTGNPTHWFWDFGDGTTSTEQNPTHTYTTVGNYTVSLTASNDSDTTTKVKNNYIIVNEQPMTFSSGFVYVSNDAGVMYDLDGATFGGPSNTYHLSSGLGTNQLHITSGTCTTASDVIYISTTGGRGYNNAIILKLIVEGPISDDFAVTLITSGYTDLDLARYVIGALNETFTKEDFIYSSGTTYIMLIDLNVGNLKSVTDGASIVEFTFSNLTTKATLSAYAWCLSANAGQGIGWTSTELYTVEIPPVANFTANTTSGEAPLTVQFTDNSVCATSWNWDFNNDGVIDSTEQNPTYTYNTPGNYTVSLTAINAIGNSTVTDYITVNWPVPVANFTTKTTSGLDPLTVQFTDTSTGNITSWSWDFDGDGVSDSTEQNPTWTYNTPGNYTVTLTVTGPGGNNTLMQNDYITVIDSTPPTVNVNPEEGAFNGTQTITLTSDQPGSTIYYTTDGTDPQNNTNKIPYTDPIQIYNTTTLKYAAVNLRGIWSQKYSKTYTIDTTPPSVTVNPVGGNYDSAQTVVLTADDETATIYYTTDGTEPTNNSTQYTTPINITTTTTLKFMAIDTAGNQGTTQTETYTIDTTPPSVTANPTGGNYNTTQTVTLTPNETSTIYYTTDGTEPTNNSTQYTTPINITTTTTLKFMAIDTAGNQGTTQTETYTIDTTPPSVTANPVGGNYDSAQTVVLTADNETATIYYTTDGTEPTNNSTQYTTPINITTTTTLKFMAIDTAGNQGTTQTETYNISSDVYVQITPSITNPTVGDQVTYTFKLGNNGPGDASNIVFTYVIPEGVEYTGANVDQGTVTYDETTKTLTWTVGNVAAGVDPYLWLNLNILNDGTFNILPTITLDSYNPLLTSNIQNLQVNIATPTTPTNTVNAATTTSVEAGTIPMQSTGAPLAGLILGILCIGSGITLNRKK